MLISHKGHTDTIQVYSVTVMTHVKALQAGHSSQGTSEPITPAFDPIASKKAEQTHLSATQSFYVNKHFGRFIDRGTIKAQSLYSVLFVIHPNHHHCTAFCLLFIHVNTL